MKRLRKLEYSVAGKLKYHRLKRGGVVKHQLLTEDSHHKLTFVCLF
ncbi:MAG TPA: hypothetical protein VGP85_18455 [Pyrinomonadaceae bacterium]|nr:hypothetical protein [Pyrinomonadaceae bacterium]